MEAAAAAEQKLMVFIPSPVMGHISQCVELAKLMIDCDRDRRLSIIFLLMKLPIDPVGTNFIDSLTTATSSSSYNRISFLHLPTLKTPKPEWKFPTPGVLLSLVVDYHKSHVKEIVANITRDRYIRVAGFVVDMLCTPMIDVAEEFGVPFYVFYTSNAAFLGMMLHFQMLYDEQGQDITKLKQGSETELIIPSFAKPVPPAVLPFVLMDKKSWTTRFLPYSRGYRKAKAIIVNTFSELESYALNSFSTSLQPVFPVGPIINRIHFPNQPDKNSKLIMDWLDDQPPLSVLFLCFGSRGVFGEEQVREIAEALERRNCRFLWSLRRPSPKGKVEFPGEYGNQGKEVLPEGFLDRTAGIGLVVSGWVPQLSVLSHGAVGGFVSHCGWNSILESMWCGVPIATWPIYAEQGVNAFQLVRELGLGVEISLDYHQDDENNIMVVTSDKIEKGIRKVMELESEVRKKVKEIGEKCRKATREGGSSCKALGSLIGLI